MLMQFKRSRQYYNIYVENNSSEAIYPHIILLKDILTFSGLDYRNASLIRLYFVVIEQGWQHP